MAASTSDAAGTGAAMTAADRCRMPRRRRRRRGPAQRAPSSCRSACASPCRSSPAGCLILSTALQFLRPEPARRRRAGRRRRRLAGRACRRCRPPGSSLRHPDLHGITDQLIALALIAAWAAGDLIDGGAAAAGHDARTYPGGAFAAGLAGGHPRAEQADPDQGPPPAPERRGRGGECRRRCAPAI